MAEQKNTAALAGGFKEAVCIDGGRVYDSCCDRDCLEDLRCYFTPHGQELIEQAVSIRCRGAEIINVFIDVEPVHLNRGFFSCDLTFFFAVKFDVFVAHHCQPIPVEGCCTFDKKVILFGSEGKVRIFSNEFSRDDACDQQVKPTNNLPKCVVQCVDPIALGARLCEATNCCEDVCCMPQCVCSRLGGEVNSCCDSNKVVYVTLGLFTIVQLIRNVQMLIPVYDFCIPEKECDHNINDNPCDVFSKLKFPTGDFFPPREVDDNHGCECSSCF